MAEDNSTNPIYFTPSIINKKFNKNSNISVLNLNIRSLNQNFEKLEILLTQLNFNPDVIGVTETWITDNREFLYTLDGYDFIYRTFTGNAGGTGFFY